MKIPILRRWVPNEENIINVIKKSNNLINFKYETADINVFTTLANYCTNLTELDLTLGHIFGIDNIDSSLFKIFRNNGNLKSIKLENFDTFTGECFLSLNKNIIEEMELNEDRNIKRDF